MSLKFGHCFLLAPLRRFNWKYPFPKHLQPSPPPKEAINTENIVKPAQPLSENDVFNGEYINRNPRNLEQMLLEVKPNGFALDSPCVVYWNKLIFERSKKHTTAKVVHNSGHTVVSASTQEWSIRRHLKRKNIGSRHCYCLLCNTLKAHFYEEKDTFILSHASEQIKCDLSTIDSNAVVNIARILALRCLQSGILFVHKEFTPQQMQTTKVRLLLETLEEEGLRSEEPSAIRLKNDIYL